MRRLIITFMCFFVGISSAYATFDPSTLKAKSAAAAVQSQTSVVDINHASAEELMSLKGIGEKRAQAIITYRQDHGQFKSVNDLTAVKGFSEKQLATLLKKNEGRIVAK